MLANVEPLLYESYLSSDVDLVSVQPPELPKWPLNYDEDMAPDETLEELGLALDNEEDCQIVATFISIVNVGKPKVVDISPPMSIKSPTSPRLSQSNHFEDKSSIYWRMPSYQSSRSSSDYSRTDRTDSFDSRSSSSISEPKTPDFGGSFSPSIQESHNTPFPRSSIPERAKTLRRQSKNLSMSLSKAFLTKLREATPAPPLPVENVAIGSPTCMSEPRGKRSTTFDFSTYQARQTPPPLTPGQKRSIDDV